MYRTISASVSICVLLWFAVSVSAAPTVQLTLDVSKAHQDQALTLLQGHAAEVECLIRHADDRPYRDLRGWTGWLYYGASATADAFVVTSSTNFNRGLGSVTFSLAESDTNTNGAWLAYITLQDADNNDYWAGTVDLVLEQTTITGAGQLVLQGVTDGSGLTGVVAGVGGWRNPTYWYLDYFDVFRAFSGTNVTTNADVIVYAGVSSETWADAQVYQEYVRGLDVGDPSWSVGPTNLATIDADGYVTAAEAGAGLVTVTAAVDGTSRTLDLQIYERQAGEHYGWIAPLPTNTVRYAITTNVDIRIAGGTGAVDLVYYSTQTGATTNYVVNTNCWAYGADLSGVPVARYIGGSWQPTMRGALVTPQHLMVAKHSDNIGTGSVVRFRGASGTIYHRTVDKILDPTPFIGFTLNAIDSRLAGNDPAKDWAFAALDSALPTNDVTYYPVWPTNGVEYLPVLYDGDSPADSTNRHLAGIPLFALDQFGQAVIVDGVKDFTDQGSATTPGTARASYGGNLYSFETSAPRLEYHRKLVVGDSSCPVFAWLDSDTLVLVWLLTSSSGGGLSNPGLHYDEMATLLATDGAALTQADLSGYVSW